MSEENQIKPMPLIQKVETEEEAEKIIEEVEKRLKGQTPVGTIPLIQIDDDPGKTNTFLLLFVETNEDDGEDHQTWLEVTGRDQAFEACINAIECIDLTKSFIAIRQDYEVEGGVSIDYVNRKSIYTFLKYVIDNALVENINNIDPDDYVADAVADSEYNNIGEE